MNPAAKTRVLVVDDSAIVRKVLSSILSDEPDIEVVGSAPDPFVARDKILKLRPDVLTLDIEMPRMDGLTFLERVMKFHPMPVIVISSLAQSSARTALEAMSRGAVDVLAKPGGPYSVGDLKHDLPRRVRAAAGARLKRAPESAPKPKPAPVETSVHAINDRLLVAIGASTGGTQAIERVLTDLPANMPPIVITQHIPPVFSDTFAQRLNKVCAVEVREAKNGDVLKPGLALVAPGNQHMVVEGMAGHYRVRLNDGPKVCYQRPSVDVLFQSVARSAGSKSVGVILTGMGHDGAEGLLEMRRTGARTCAQDEESCVVFGMPREAIIQGAAERVLPLDHISSAIIDACRAA